jgi:hypothetical protein
MLVVIAVRTSFAVTQSSVCDTTPGLSESERAGCRIWIYATAADSRFHTYTAEQRLGVIADWFLVLHSTARDQRFKTWGLINDPDCCVPGTPNCPAKSLDETYGFDWCPGDEDLLKFVGKPGYRDPACDFKDAPLAKDDPHGPADQRQNPCDLAFGTSTGALGFRKFPNPRFNPAAWTKVNGHPGTWEGFGRKLSKDPSSPDSRISHISDGSIEPPFLVGMACGACHIAFDPVHPPTDPAHPRWANILPAIGNQYLHISEILAAGMTKNALEWQVFAHARPGTVDTSAEPNDQIDNAGTMNALLDLPRRPTFQEQVTKWRKVKACPAGANEDCWCEPGRTGKCWLRSTQTDTIMHILKDGADSIGPLEALQRVYLNIGSCSEQCWLNHLTDMRQLDPAQRNFGQTPFDIGQCRRDCPNFRAIEDRLADILTFLLSARANELYEARGLPDAGDLVEQLDGEFGAGAVSRGKRVFAANCARCHSSQPEPFDNRDFRETVGLDGGSIRKDFLSTDQPLLVSEIGTNRCRALHSNHMKGHVWDQYASDTYHARPPDPNLKEPDDGGRSYYRNLSLVSVWAHAPFMHNNGIGPEICGSDELYRSPYVDAQGKLLANPPACWPYDPSVAGRYKLFKASMHDLLYPKQRIPKTMKLDADIIVDFGPKIFGAQHAEGMTIRIPQGTNVGLMGNFQHKQFVIDLVLALTDQDTLRTKLAARVGPDKAKSDADDIHAIALEVLKSPTKMIDIVAARLPMLLELYSSCTDSVENDGHRFGEDLPDADKNALTAFLATL